MRTTAVSNACDNRSSLNGAELIGVDACSYSNHKKSELMLKRRATASV